jgi:ribosome recycling factor
MTEELNLILEMAEEQMLKAIQHLENELTTVRAGKANPNMLNHVKVDYYGASTPLPQVSSVSNQDGRTLIIKPFEKSLLNEIEKAIFQANLGVTPQNDGIIIRITIPMLTEERRKDLVKQIKNMGENAKVGIRNARREANEEIKKLQKDGLPEDIAKSSEEKIQKRTDDFIKKVETELDIKEADIMKV